MDILALSSFILTLVICIVLGYPLLIALSIGLIIFLAYGRYKRLSFRELGKLCLEGILTTKTILIFFCLIGIMIGLWRACGTIPVIICYAAMLIKPEVFILLTFWLCCGISFLTGSSFASAGTMGVVCMTMANTFGISTFWVGGAVLSGIYFGDRCSPVSSSAQLVAMITKTEIYTNLRYMFKDALVPFFIASAIYGIVGFFSPANTMNVDVKSIFQQGFVLSPLCIAPAILILAFAALRLNVKMALISSIVLSILLAFFIQGLTLKEIMAVMLWGYKSNNAVLAQMMNGGGLASMAAAAFVICISACYSGIFRATGLLLGLVYWIKLLAQKTTKFFAVWVTGMLMGAVSCNQTLSAMLTQQLCANIQTDNQQLARDMENTLIPGVAMIPWCIASSVPLSVIGAPTIAILGACYLYCLPLWQLYVTRKL